MQRLIPFLMLALLLTGCEKGQPGATRNGDATQFTELHQAARIAIECANEHGFELLSEGSGSGGDGVQASWHFGLGFFGDEADREALMRALEEALDEALERDDLEIGVRSHWSEIPGFGRTYESASQRGVFTVYSTVTDQGMVYLRGRGQEFPR